MSQKVLVIGAHPDDEVLGCGGAIARHTSQGDEVYVLILTDGESSRPSFDTQKRASCLSQACQALGVKQVAVASFKDSLLDSYPLLEVVREIEKVAAPIRPQIIYTHSATDINIDHIITHQAVMTAFRGLPGASVTQILTFEIPSSSEWGSFQQRMNFTPNYFIELRQSDWEVKKEALNSYQEEMREFPHPRSEEYILSLQKVRGASIGVKMAEAFFSERIIVKG